MKIYYAECRESRGNCLYPHGTDVTDKDSLRAAVANDYVCATYSNNYRRLENFVESDCIAMDCDNDHSDNPADWVTPADIKNAFPDVEFGIHYSRSNMVPKGGKSARPKFHVLFPLSSNIDSAEEYAQVKRLVYEKFPYFDKNALDAARFFFGTGDKTKVDYICGSRRLDEYMEKETTMIREGERNSTLSRTAAKALVRYGITEEARNAFLEAVNDCFPPLSDKETETIWASAVNFYSREVAPSEEYIEPSKYVAKTANFSVAPADYSDVGQAAVLAKISKNKLCFTLATGFLHYNGSKWAEDELMAQQLAQQLTDKQLAEANSLFIIAQTQMKETGAADILRVVSEEKAKTMLSEEQKEAFGAWKKAKAYCDYVVRSRSSQRIRACLSEVRPMVQIALEQLDADPYALCTPAGTYDLRKGISGCRDNNAADYITKCTSVSPSDDGAQLWIDQLNCVFCGDSALVDYVQLLCGTMLVGAVKLEGIIIAYGGGRNGKSTFWNTLARVLGDYSGTISADTLTTSCRHNTRPELAELRGKRLVIAAEMCEGAILNDSMVKQISSTDLIHAEKKYKAPFEFAPSHTLVLYTNHLPRVRATDHGTWRRLHVIPFDAKISESSDIKDYAEYLFQHAGGSILKWLLEGAQRAYDCGYKFPVPDCVKQAVEAYRQANDWFSAFLEDCCEIGEDYEVPSGALYTAYRDYCATTGEYVRCNKDFYSAVEAAGYIRKKRHGYKFFTGLRIKANTGNFAVLEEDDELPFDA